MDRYKVGRRGFMGLLLGGAAAIAVGVPNLESPPPPPPIWTPPPPKVWQLDRTMLVTPPAPQIERAWVPGIYVDGKRVAALHSWTMNSRTEVLSIDGFGRRTLREGQRRQTMQLRGRWLPGEWDFPYGGRVEVREGTKTYSGYVSEFMDDYRQGLFVALEVDRVTEDIDEAQLARGHDGGRGGYGTKGHLS